MHDTTKSGNVVLLTGRSKSTRLLEIDFFKIQRDGFQLVRGFGADSARLETELNCVSGNKLFYSARMGSFVHEYQVLPYSENLSEQASSGGYHTDFMFQPRPPEFIALLCLRPDPKHPLYGRNQIVHLDAFIARMNSAYGITEADLLKQLVEYSFVGRSPIKVPILHNLNGKRILKMHTALMPTGPIPSFENVPLKAVIEAVCSDVAHDIVLDQGDLLIMTNHCALHRRTECTFAFNSIGSAFTSREMATIRFDQ